MYLAISLDLLFYILFTSARSSSNVLSVEGVAIASDKETKVFGPYDTKEEFLDAIKPYCEERVRLGNMTQQEADDIIERYE